EIENPAEHASPVEPAFQLLQRLQRSAEGHGGWAVDRRYLDLPVITGDLGLRFGQRKPNGRHATEPARQPLGGAALVNDAHGLLEVEGARSVSRGHFADAV